MVRDIYNMFLDGMSKNAIVRELNDHGVLNPAAYKRHKGLKYQNPFVDPAKPALWSAISITQVLTNRVYCGDMVQGKYRVKSYKIHVQEKMPEDEWYIVENTHEPIIDRATFEKVQRLLLRDTRTAPQKKERLPIQWLSEMRRLWQVHVKELESRHSVLLLPHL